MHAMLVHFPIGLCIGSVVGDALGIMTGNASWFEVARLTLSLGLVAAAPTAIAGFVDFVSAANRGPSEVVRTATNHMLAALLGVALFVASLLLRGRGLAVGIPFAVSLTGAAVFAVTGRLGGKLVWELGVGSVGVHEPESQAQRTDM